MRQVKELMTRDVVTLREMDNLARIDQVLQQGEFHHLPVVREGRLVGLVTHRDLLEALARVASEAPRETLWAMDVMTRDVVTVSPTTPLREALRLAREQHLGCLPVVDARGMLVGILTMRDFVRLAQELLGDVDQLETAREYR